MKMLQQINVNEIFNESFICFNSYDTAKNDVINPKIVLKKSIGEYYTPCDKCFDTIFKHCETQNLIDETDSNKILDLLYYKLIDIQNFNNNLISIENSTNSTNVYLLCLRKGLKNKFANDIELIINIMYVLEIKFKDDPYIHNAFKKLSRLLKSNVFNYKDNIMPKSIVNYTTFKFCVDGYPCETKNNKIYSILNTNNININSFQKIEYSNKNINSLFYFVEDINICKNDVFSLLKSAYGILTSLMCLKSEITQYENNIRKN